MSESFDFSTPDLFTAGTIGPPGQRVFYLQAREGDALVTLKCEKEQVRVLGEYLGRLLERLSTPATAGGADLALIEPVDAGLDRGVDRRRLRRDGGPRGAGDRRGPGAGRGGGDRGVGAGGGEESPAQAEPETEPEEESGAAGGDRASGRVRLTRAQVAAFVERARGLIEAGRPTCRFCGRPMNPGGHRCARTNGHGSD